jgi:calmodulin
MRTVDLTVVTHYSLGDDNPIQFPTFEQMVGDMLDSGGPLDSEVLDAFKVFDREGNGYISAAELKHLLVGLPGDLDEGESKCHTLTTL